MVIRADRGVWRSQLIQLSKSRMRDFELRDLQEQIAPNLIIYTVKVHGGKENLTIAGLLTAFGTLFADAVEVFVSANENLAVGNGGG